MTTKTRRPSETIRAQRADIDATVGEFHRLKDELRYRRDLSDVGKADAARALRDQYREHLAAEGASAWKIAGAALDAARADYRKAHAAHTERLDPARLQWYAREYAARLAAAPVLHDGVGNFDAAAWLMDERNRLAAVDDVTAMRALRVVTRERLGSIGDGEAAARLESVLRKDEADEAADVLAAQREVAEAERAAADLRRRIEQHREALDPGAAGNILGGPDAFARQVFGEDRAAANVLAPAVA